MTRFTKEEAKIYAALALVSGGRGFSVNNFMTIEGMTLERAEELESYKADMNEEEIEMIADCLPAIPGITKFKRKLH